jgi:hypothetical protein
MPVIDYCNSPLNNKNIDYHCPMVFRVLVFHVNHCVNCDCCCVWFVLGFICMSEWDQGDLCERG